MSRGYQTLFLPTPPPYYDAQDQRETRRAIERGFLQSSTSSGISDTHVFVVTDSPYNADPTGSVDSTAAFLAAIADAMLVNGTVDIPQGRYLVSGTGTEIFAITDVIRIRGYGITASTIVVDASVPATTDVFRLVGLPSGDFLGLEFTAFAILPASGNPGRHCINVDVTTGQIAYCRFDFLWLGSLSDYSFNVTNPAPRTDGFYTSV